MNTGKSLIWHIAVPLVTLVAASSSAQAAQVAITFDDLPLFGADAPPAEAEKISSNLLDGFKRHHWKVTGFVNEEQLEARRAERINLLRRWLDAGMDLGNHSYSHVSLTRTPVEAYIADVARGETVTKELLAQHGRTERWYRYPYLETGPTIAIRKTFEVWLAAHGYRVAPVTMENSDWEFAEPYDDALAHQDTAAANHIRSAYLAYTKSIVPWYTNAAKALLGRKPAFVFLLHASRLNAASVDALAAIFKANDLRPVSLAKAMRDFAYRIHDDYAGPDGDEWLTRWAMTLHKDLPYATLPKVPKDIARADARVEAATPDAQAPAVPQP